MESLNAVKVNRFVCPALAIIGMIVALWGQWFTTTTSVTGRVLDSTLLEVLQGDSFVEYTSSRWIWLSGVGVLLVLASAAVNDVLRKKLAQTGAYLMVILPAWSLFNVFADGEDIDAGWALYITTVITIVVILLASRIPEEEPVVVPRKQTVDDDQPIIG